MTAGPAGGDRQACAGGIVLDAAGRLLVIQRRNLPSAGLWSIPGGRCAPGESPLDACIREVAEETGLDVAVVRLAGRVELDAPNGGIYDVDDFVCEPVGGALRAGDDATQARWVDLAEFTALPTAPGLYDALRGWGLLPR